jgi:PTS system nitrogen regulatory IIA component
LHPEFHPGEEHAVHVREMEQGVETMDLTAKDAAKMLGVSEDVVYQWMHDGSLPCYHVRDKYRLNRVELLEWATARKMTVAPEYFHANGAKPPELLLTHALRRGGVVADLPCEDKASALKSICGAMRLPAHVDREELHSVLVAREALCSTGIGNGIAIPHPRGPIVLGIDEPLVMLAYLRQPIEFGAIDGKPVSTLFTIVSTTVRVHLLMLSHLMFGIQDEDFKGMLAARAPEAEILARLEAIEGKVATPGSGQGAVQ